MHTVKSFFSAIKYSLNLVVREKLYLYFSFAILISLLFYYIFSGGEALSSKLSFMEDWWIIGWIVTSFESFFSFISFMIFEFLVLVLLSPVNAILAEKVREDITGEKLEFSISVFLSSLRRMVVIIIVGICLQLLFMIVFWLLSFLFGDFFFEIASILTIAFFIGFSFFDFILELEGINSRKSWKYARKNWFACILIGLVFNLGIYYPQKHDLLIIYVIAIALLPHLLSMAATKMYLSANHNPTKDATIPIKTD